MTKPSRFRQFLSTIAAVVAISTVPLPARAGAYIYFDLVTATAFPRAVLGAQGAAPVESPEQPGQPPAEANSPAANNRAQAMEAYARGTEHYNNARYESALAEFQVAASLHASPDFQYNLALCYEKLNKYEEAIRAYETYLRTKGDAPDRANVEDRIERLRQQQRAAESASEPQPVQDEPQPVPADAAPVASKPSKPLIIAGAVIMGVGAALALGGGIGFGIVARKRSRELDDIQSGGNPQDKTLDDARDIERAGKRAETMQFALAVTGGVITIAGAAMLAVGVHRQRKAARERTARIVPHIGPRFSGLGIHGSF